MATSTQSTRRATKCSAYRCISSSKTRTRTASSIFTSIYDIFNGLEDSIERVEDCDLKEHTCVLRFSFKDFGSVSVSPMIDYESESLTDNKKPNKSHIGAAQRNSRFNNTGQKAYNRKMVQNNYHGEEIKVQAWIHHGDTKGTDLFVINFMKSLEEFDGLNNPLLLGHRDIDPNLSSALSVRQGSDASMLSRSRINARPKTRYGTAESPFKASKPNKVGDANKLDIEKAVKGLINDTKSKINKFKMSFSLQFLFKLGLFLSIITLALFLAQFGLQIYYIYDAENQMDIRWSVAIMKNAISTLTAINLTQVIKGHQKMWQGDPVMLERIVKLLD
jgi:hypothetical protein